MSVLRDCKQMMRNGIGIQFNSRERERAHSLNLSDSTRQVFMMYRTSYFIAHLSPIAAALCVMEVVRTTERIGLRMFIL